MRPAGPRTSRLHDYVNPCAAGRRYHHRQRLQQRGVTDVPDGTYYLTHTADPENHWAESDETNNFTWLKIKLQGQGGNRKVTIVDHAACVPEVVCGFGGNP